MEHATQEVSTFQLFNPDDEPVRANLKTLDLLPAAHLSWELLPGMLLRSGFSITVSRPDFRELSPATFNDVTGGRMVFGNPELERAVLYAGDLRWEWYPAPGRHLSAAVFYKHFENPIEQVVVLSAQHSVTFANAESADNLGAEVELRSDLGVFHDALEPLFVAGNAALIYSRVFLDKGGVQTSDDRPLQGQSPWVLNLEGGYESEATGLRLVVLYNVFGPRIAEVGAQGAPDVYEQPFHRLDLVLKQELAGGLSVGVKAQNLLDLPASYTQGSTSSRRSFVAARWP